MPGACAFWTRNCPLPDIARTMLADGLALYDLHLCEDTLEDYFKRVIGGEGIA